jgi:hypothetical protein
LRHYELRLQRAGVVDDKLPNVPFALLTLRWAINDLGLQPGYATERTENTEYLKTPKA